MERGSLSGSISEATMLNASTCLFVCLVLLCALACTSFAQEVPALQHIDFGRIRADSSMLMLDLQFSSRMAESLQFAVEPHALPNLAMYPSLRPTLTEKLIGAGFLTAVLITSDDKTAHRSERWYARSPKERNLGDSFVLMGDGAPHLGLAGAFAVVGLATSDRRTLRTGSAMVRAILGTGLLVQTLKRIAGRQRPSHATHPRGNWRPFPNQKQYNKNIPAFDAFPSGHIATTTTTLTVLMESYPEATWLRPVSYAIIGAVGFGLASAGMHWYSDFPLGIVLGHLIGKLAVNSASVFDDSAPSGTEPSMTISPLLTEGRVGVELHIAL
jgi:membrane-associated phospholipid phosphatase